MSPHRLFRVLLASTFLLVVVGVFPASAQEMPEMSEGAQASMNAWMELAMPGEHHGHIAAYEGSWTSEMTMWMEPGAEPMKQTATAEARWILGGRYLEWTHSGDFAGMPYEARQFDAYNNGEQRYEATWIDNFGTLILHYTGECDGTGKVRTMQTEFSDPVTGGTITNRAVYTWQDEDHWLYESFMTMGGEEFKNMEIRYSRAP